MIYAAEKLRDLLRQAKGSAQIVLLRGEIGRGKTFAIQQFYDSWCDEMDSNGTWRRGLVPDGLPGTSEKLQEQRKMVSGLKVSPIRDDTPWLWIGATCRPSSRVDDFDAAAAELSEQLDGFVFDLGAEVALGATKVLFSGALNFAGDIFGVSAAKTIAETVWGLSKLINEEYSSQPSHRARLLRTQRSKLVQETLRRLGVEQSAGCGKPLVAVLDDAHLATPESLRLLSSLLMPATETAPEEAYFPRGVSARQSPIIVVLCRWTHTGRTPAHIYSPLNDWIRQAKAVGIPIKTIDMPRGMQRSEALRLTAEQFPALREEDRQAVVGVDWKGKVNPLVLTMRMVTAAGYLDDRRSATSLDGFDLSVLPSSPLAPVHAIFEDLPVSEKKAVAGLAAFGAPAPLDLLCDDSDATPSALLSAALEKGLVVCIDEDFSTIWFTDDLTVAYFENRQLPFPEIESIVITRFRSWLGRVARDEKHPISAMARINEVVVGAMQRHHDHPEIKWFVNSALMDTAGSYGAPKGRRQVLKRFRREVETWSDEDLAAQILACALMPKRLGAQTWSELFADATVRRCIAQQPYGLASRAVALSQRTMPCPELRDSVLSAVAIDGEVALRRLVAIAGLFTDVDVSTKLKELELGEDLTRAARLAVAQIRGPDDVITLLENDLPRNESEVIILSDSYAAKSRFDEASERLFPLRASLEFAVRGARWALQAGLRKRAELMLRPHAAVSVQAALDMTKVLDDVEEAIAVLEPYLDLNPEARLRAAKLRAADGRFREAIAILLPLKDSGLVAVTQALRSLRGHSSWASRQELLQAAEEAWKSGDCVTAMSVLGSSLDDAVILSVWAEYTWLSGDRHQVISELHAHIDADPKLAASLGELANEAPIEARRFGWLDRPSVSNEVLWLATVRLIHQLDGSSGVSAESLCRDQGLPSSIYRIVRAVEHAGSDWDSDRKLALVLEANGHIDWAEEIVNPWGGEGRGEAHAVRLLVSYGQLAQASARLDATHDRSITMTSARASWHLAHDAPDEAARSFRNCSSMTPQVRRLGEILSDIANNPRAAIEASRLLSLMRQHSTAVDVLAYANRSYEHPDIVRAYKKARYKTPEPQRIAYGRLRRRHAIRAALAEADEVMNDEA